jgi:mRNA interferase MazF
VYAALLDPIKGSEQAGTRPVIVVSRDAINRNSSVVVCVPCTDAENCSKIYPSQALLKKGIAGLALDSVVLCEQIRAISVQRLGKHIGKVDRETMRGIDERIKIALNLD